MTSKSDSKKDDEPLSERMIVPVSKGMLADIKAYWHAAQLDSRADAVRRLIRIGLDAERKSGKR